MAHRFGAAIDIARRRTRQTANGGCFGPAGDLTHGLEIANGSGGEAGLDDVDAHGFEQLTEREFLIMRHGRAGRLLAIAHSGVENYNISRVGHLFGLVM